MADIHVLTGAYRVPEQAVYKQYALHFPIASSAQVDTASCDPNLANFSSLVPGIAASELNAIRSGEIAEVIVTDKYHTWDTAGTVLARIRTIYASLWSEIETTHANKYESYLATVSASP